MRNTAVTDVDVMFLATIDEKFSMLGIDRRAFPFSLVLQKKGKSGGAVIELSSAYTNKTIWDVHCMRLTLYA